MANFNEIARRIIEEQATVIGPLAWNEAGKVQGLTIVSRESGQVEINASDQSEVINKLVAQYERLFGQASHEVCRDSVASLLALMPVNEVPASLR